MWLRLNFCKRAGLLIKLRAKRYSRFGFVTYQVEIPSDLPSNRAIQIARAINRNRRLLKLGYVAGRLLKQTGRRDFNGSHTLARIQKAKVR